MGFVKRNIQVEEYLDSIGAAWEYLSDSDYKRILSELNEFIDAKKYSEYLGDDAFNKLQDKTPIKGFIFSCPKHKLFSIYVQGGENLTFGYSIEGIRVLNREKLNEIECVMVNDELTFACVLNHEWRAMCLELYIEKTV